MWQLFLHGHRRTTYAIVYLFSSPERWPTQSKLYYSHKFMTRFDWYTSRSFRAVTYLVLCLKKSTILFSYQSHVWVWPWKKGTGNHEVSKGVSGWFPYWILSSFYLDWSMRITFLSGRLYSYVIYCFFFSTSHTRDLFEFGEVLPSYYLRVFKSYLMSNISFVPVCVNRVLHEKFN